MRVINSSNWRELVRSPRGLTLRDLWQDSCALVVPPAKSMPSDCERPKASHPPNADYDTILFEWTEFLGALRQCGVELISPEIDEWFADQVFVGDHLRLFGHLCVQGQMQSRRRQREAQRIAKAARRLIPCENWRSIAACDPTAVLEIGNIVAFPECRLAFVGISGRVNESGVRVFRQICAELDWRAVPTEFDSSRITHLSTAIAPIGDGVALVDPTATDPVHLNRQGIETIDTPPHEPQATSSFLVSLAKRKCVIVPKDNPETCAILDRRGCELLICAMDQLIDCYGVAGALCAFVKAAPEKRK